MTSYSAKSSERLAASFIVVLQAMMLAKRVGARQGSPARPDDADILTGRSAGACPPPRDHQTGRGTSPRATYPRTRAPVLGYDQEARRGRRLLVRPRSISRSTRIVAVWKPPRKKAATIGA